MQYFHLVRGEKRALHIEKKRRMRGDVAIFGRVVKN